jgi:hypothetical protein
MPPGSARKSVAALRHQRLALVHGLHDVQLVAGVVGLLLIHQRLRNHAQHAPARLPRGLGHHAHQAVAPAAIHQLPAVRAYPLAHCSRSLGELWALPGARAAIHAEGKSRFSHGQTSAKALQPRCPRTAAARAALRRCPCPWHVWTDGSTRGRCGRWRFRCRC